MRSRSPRRPSGPSRVLTVVELFVGTRESVGLYMMVCVVLLPYALVRWAAGGEIVIGLALVVLTGVLGISLDYTGVGDAIGAATVLLVPALLGGTVRAVTTARARELDQVRLREREQLARELHDTVAHHVSAIVIRAQAGRVVVGPAPERRRRGAWPSSRRKGCARSPRCGRWWVLCVTVRSPSSHLTTAWPTSSCSRVRPVVGRRSTSTGAVTSTTSVPRRALRSTGSRRSRSPTRCVMPAMPRGSTSASPAWTTGSASSSATTERPRTAAPAGYGLVGMAERAALLGGSLEAGPNDGRGWTVSASLPKAGPAR